VAEHEKARGVVRFVLDVAGEDTEIVTLGGRFPGERRRARFRRGQLRRLRVAADRDAPRLGQRAVEPFMALRQRLRV
jgi:hypothetical protein